MTRHARFKRVVVFASLLVVRVLHGQQQSPWQDHFLQGSKAIQLGHYPDARRLLLAALEDSNQFEVNDLRSAETKAALANLYTLQGELNLASELYQQSRAIVEANGDTGKPFLAALLDGLGEVRVEQARWTEAEQLLQQSYALHVELDGDNSPMTMAVARHLGELYACTGRDREAENLLQRAITVFRKSQHPEALASALMSLGRIYLEEARYPLAENALKEAVGLDQRLGENHPALGDAWLNLAILYRVEGHTERAEPLLQKAAKIYRDASDPHLAAVLSEMGLIALQHRKYAIAEANLKQALDILAETFRPDHVSVGVLEGSLAQVYFNEGEYSKAELFIRRALEKERRSLGEASFELAQSVLIAAQIEEKQNRRLEADADYRRAVALFGRLIGENHPGALHAQELYSRFAKKIRRSDR